MKLSPPSYYRHRFPSEIISRCVWLYFRFALSYRDVDEMMHERGVNVTYETVREWCLKFATSTPDGCARAALDPVTIGIWTKSF
jgi:putative transposase